MKEPYPLIIVEFFDFLSSRARYGNRGEKPVAVVAALGYLFDNEIEGIGILELLENPLHYKGVRERFLQLASRFGKMSTPRSSWSVITGRSREMQRAVEEYVGVDEAFKKLTKDEIRNLYNSLLEKPDHRKSRYRKLISKRERVERSLSNEFIIRGSRDLYGPIEVWSNERLPFEPEGWLKELRDEICFAIKGLEGDSESVLHAVYMSEIEELFDVENILLYNIGAGCFSKVAQKGIRFERAFTRPPDSSVPEKLFPHYQSYQLVMGQERFKFWSKGRRLAYWKGVKCSSLTDASYVWYRMITGSRELVSSLERGQKRFGLSVLLHATPRIMMNLVSIIKPVFDGVVASFHQHDGTKEAEICHRLAESLGSEPGEIKELLNQPYAILGRRRLLWPWRHGVQWNPGDEGCVAGELLLLRDRSGTSFELSGEIFEVEESKVLDTAM